MENPIILGAKLRLKRSELEDTKKALRELDSQKTVILRAADEAKTTEEVDDASKKATDLDTQIKTVKDDAAKLTTDIADLEKAIEESNGDDDSSEEDDQTSKPTEPNKNSKKGGEQRMHNVHKITAEERGLMEYFNSKGEKRDGIVTGDVAAIIPKQIIYNAEQEVKTAYDLSKFVDVINTSDAGGSWNTIKKVDTTLHTVAELEANPKLAKPELLTVDWIIKTYRGAIPASNESITDAAQLQAIIKDALDQVILNTKNSLISGVLKTAPTATAKDTDGIKKIVNVDLDPAYEKSIITTQSGFQFLDTLKDNDGRYLMQPDVTSPTGYRFLGLEVQPVADTLLGVQGDALAYIGDAKRFVKLFDRQEIQIGWNTNETFSQNMLVALRLDVEAADTAAGFLVTFGPKA